MSEQEDPLAVPLRATSTALRWWLMGCVVALIAGFIALALCAPGPSMAEIATKPGALLLLALILLADIYPRAPWMRHAEVLDQFIMSTPLAIAALMVFGPSAAAMFVVAGAIMSLALRQVWWRVLLNTALWGLQGLMAAGVMIMITDPFGWQTALPSIAMIPITLALALVIELSNVGLVGTSWRLAGAITWREYFADWHSQIAVGALALTAPIPAVIAQVHPGLLPLLALAMVAAQSGMNAVASRTALAGSDPLTAIANRATLMNRLTARIGQLREPGETVTLLLIDLDKFKAINDDYGHLAGDRVLVEVARRLEDSTRSADLVARFGGDEFAVLLEGGVPGRSVAEVVERISVVIARPMQVLERPVVVGITAGSAVARDRSVSAVQLIEWADAELYRAKSARPVGGCEVPDQPVGRSSASTEGRATDGSRRSNGRASTRSMGTTSWAPPRWSHTRPGVVPRPQDNGAVHLTGTRLEQ